MSASSDNEGSRETTPWRLSLLVVDDRPYLRSVLYDHWAERGATLEVEADPVEALDRIEAGRYTYVFISLALRGRLGRPGQFLGTAVRRWAREHAPNYRGRFLYFGEADLIERAVPGSVRELGEPPVFELSQEPIREEIDSATARLDELLGTTPAERAADWERAAEG